MPSAPTTGRHAANFSPRTLAVEWNSVRAGRTNDVQPVTGPLREAPSFSQKKRRWWVVMEMRDFIVPSHVTVDLQAEDKEELLRELARKAGRALRLAPDAIAKALLQRERLGTTATGGGIAIPHARLRGVSKPFAMLVRLRQAIDFDAVDEVPVDIICLLLLPENPQGGWLSALAVFARTLRDAVAVKAIREARDNWEAYCAFLGDPHHSGSRRTA
jgi:nitrogen PTS system EIIA component